MELIFDEPSHTYTVDGKAYTSVTQWVHQHFKPFDADEVIRKMMASHRWPQSKYFGQEPETIKASWKANGEEQSTKGTLLHADIEQYYRGVQVERDSVEWKQFLQFAEDHKELKVVEPEWRIFDSEAQIAGTVDMVFRNADGSVSVYDWKRSKEFKRENRWQNATTAELSHLPDCNVSHYRLQLTLYKAILERNYDVQVRDMYLIRFHPNADAYEKFKVEEVPEVLDMIWRPRKKAQ